MATTNRLTDKGARAAGLGKHADGNGLQLVVRKTAAGEISRNWVLRYRSPTRKDREMGLGVFPLVSLQAAREARDDARRLLARSLDPLNERERVTGEMRAAEDQARQRRRTFDEVAELVMAAQSFTSPKHQWQWSATLAKYATPAIGKKPIGEVTTEDVVKIIDRKSVV